MIFMVGAVANTAPINRGIVANFHALVHTVNIVFGHCAFWHLKVVIAVLLLLSEVMEVVEPHSEEVNSPLSVIAQVGLSSVASVIMSIVILAVEVSEVYWVHWGRLLDKVTINDDLCGLSEEVFNFLLFHLVSVLS